MTREEILKRTDDMNFFNHLYCYGIKLEQIIEHLPFEVKTGNNPIRIKDERDVWLGNNSKGIWTQYDSLYFELEEDAVMFKLRF